MCVYVCMNIGKRAHTRRLAVIPWWGLGRNWWAREKECVFPQMFVNAF